MKYPEEFKEQVRKTFRYNEECSMIITAIENEQHTVVRYVLEDALDKLNLDEEILDEGDLIVFNSKLKQKREILTLYSQFMALYNIYLTEKEKIYE